MVDISDIYTCPFIDVHPITFLMITEYLINHSKLIDWTLLIKNMLYHHNYSHSYFSKLNPFIEKYCRKHAYGKDIVTLDTSATIESIINCNEYPVKMIYFNQMIRNILSIGVDKCTLNKTYSWAINNNSLELAKILLDYGADPNIDALVNLVSDTELRDIIKLAITNDNMTKSQSKIKRAELKIE